MLGRGKGTDIEVLESVDFPASVGLFYTAFTQFLGFPHYGDEYKVMGLAPYGTPHYVDKVAQVLPLKEGGLYHWKSAFSISRKGSFPTQTICRPWPPCLEQIEALFGLRENKGGKLTQYHMDLAASVQRHTEEVIFHVLRRLHELTGLARVALQEASPKTALPTAKYAQHPFPGGVHSVCWPRCGHFHGLSAIPSIKIWAGLVPPPCSVLTQEASLETTRSKPI